MLEFLRPLKTFFSPFHLFPRPDILLMGWWLSGSYVLPKLFLWIPDTLPTWHPRSDVLQVLSRLPRPGLNSWFPPGLGNLTLPWVFPIHPGPRPEVWKSLFIVPFPSPSTSSASESYVFDFLQHLYFVYLSVSSAPQPGPHPSSLTCSSLISALPVSILVPLPVWNSQQRSWSLMRNKLSLSFFLPILFQ